MLNAFDDTPISYVMLKNNASIVLSDYIGKELSIVYHNEIRCCSCGRKTSKSFMNGYCFPCFQSSPETSPCIVRPELCRAHLGEGRDPEWEQKHHNQEHIVYLAYTSGFKVGVTRASYIPTRWFDQGAIASVVLARTPNRYLAGCIEVALKEIMADKTSWQRMLKQGPDDSLNFDDVMHKAVSVLPIDLKQYVNQFATPYYWTYPVIQYPEKVKSLTLDKAPLISGTLTGIKGQYLYIDSTHVFNVRRHTGYVASIDW
ncbi:DUF2797 domain-containing protein [bacterium]|nr:DUF2797 domain-containing protein [bacterium]